MKEVGRDINVDKDNLMKKSQNLFRSEVPTKKEYLWVVGSSFYYTQQRRLYE